MRWHVLSTRPERGRVRYAAGFLGFWVLRLLDAWVEVLAVGLSWSTLLARWSVVVLEVLVVDVESLLNLLAQSVVIASAATSLAVIH